MLFKREITNKTEERDYRLSVGCVLYYLMSVLNATVKTILPDSGIVSILSLLTGAVILLGFLQCLPAA